MVCIKLRDKMSKKPVCPICKGVIVIITGGWHHNQGFCEKCQKYHYIDGYFSMMPLVAPPEVEKHV
jgi:hypothetical protein